ncbi:MAG TPA: Dabb family protein [Phycisphaerales bacterium]|nr:Dabb family protein [Phycisphaerales bacterium]
MPMHRHCCRGMSAFIAIAVIALSAIGCETTAPVPKRRAGDPAPRPAPINHLVFFKLKNPADATELIADADSQLGTLPMVAWYFCGRHLDTGRGERVDSNYDVGFYVAFANEADYAAYVAHPSHQALVAKWQSRWEWIRVQDVLDTTP